MKESYLLSGELEETNDAYAIAKIAGIMMCYNYSLNYRLNYKSLMPPNLFGPGDNYDLKNSHFFPALLKKIYQAGLRAPDHGGLQPWKFIEESGDNRIELGKKFVSVTKKIKKNPSLELLNKVKKAPLRAPLIIIVIANIKENTPIPAIEQILSAGAAAQNMMLASSSMGFHSIWRRNLL